MTKEEWRVHWGLDLEDAQRVFDLVDLFNGQVTKITSKESV